MGSKVDGAKATLYINKYFDNEGAIEKLHIFAGNMKVATVDGEATVFHHDDHLTGSNVETDINGDMIELLDYYPYGSIRINDKTGNYKNNYKFTGKELDDATGLYYYGARYYSASLGRFVSVDPWFGNLNDPQSLNKFTYVRNNPLKYTDPTGKFWWYGFYDWTGYEGVTGFLMKAGEVLGGHDRALDVIEQGQPIVDSTSAKYGVDPNLTNAIIYEEQSHLTPDEILGREQLFPNFEPSGYDGGVGIMQVSGKIGKNFGNYSKTELARDPVKNIDSGVSYLSAINQNQCKKPAIVGKEYNGSNSYGERIASQMNNSKYNTNIVSDILQGAANSIKESVGGIIDKFTK
jgi:RHS repeat-associated protein